MDLGAMTSFKDNLFEKKVGGLRTSLNAGSDNVYSVEWNASRLNLGSIYGSGSDDAYCTMQVHDIYADSLHLHTGSAATFSSVRDEIDALSSRLDALGFRKAPSFGHGAVSQYVGDYRDAFEGSDVFYPDEKVGWSEFSHLSDDNAGRFPGEGKLNDFTLMRIGKIAIIQGSAWYRFKGYLGNTESPELLLKVSIPEGFRMVPNLPSSRKCYAFSAFVQPGATSSFTPRQFPSKDCFVFDYGMDGSGISFGMHGVDMGDGTLIYRENLIAFPLQYTPAPAAEFWLRCPTGPDKVNYQSIRLSLNGWWQCEEDLPEPTDLK